MFYILLQAGPKEGSNGSLLIIAILLVIWLLATVFNRFSITRRLMLIMNMNRYGADSYFTISSVSLFVSKLLEKKGLKIQSLNLVYEFGNRYQGILKLQNGEEHEITVIADRVGSVMYSIK